MQHLRHAKKITRLVLAWFVLSIGAAVAAPLLTSQDAVSICSANGMLFVTPGGDTLDVEGLPGRASPKLKCPLCLLLDAPPHLLDISHRVVHLTTATPLQHTSSEAPLASPCAAPLPARGPPAIVPT
jgi:hypothetical protein